MRVLSTLAALSLMAAPAAAQAPRPLPTHAPLVADTTDRIAFDIPPQRLSDALVEFSRQSAVRVELDLGAARAVRSVGVSGTVRPTVALRRMLEGTGLTARFTDAETARVVGEIEGRVYTLTPLVVVGQRTRGYAARRTSSATRTDIPLREVPQSISVVSKQVIADQAMQGMADVVRYVPGVSMGQGEGHRDAPTIRGVSSTADFFVDGVRDDVQYLRDLYNVERVEALKGPNAMVFGRGGGGGVLNRVTKQAQWAPTRAVTLEGGSFDHKRATVDVGQGFGSAAALRVTGMYEDSRGFRDRFSLSRFGVNPTAALALGTRTTLRAGYEHFEDDRTVDRGIPSFEGRPFRAPITQYFGNPDSSYATARVDAASAVLEHVAPGGLTVRNHTRWADYAKHYQNSFGSALNAAGTRVNLVAYGTTTDRANLFNQTDLVATLGTGPVGHTLLVGAEVGRQETDNFRRTGYYNGSATSFAAPLDAPTVTTPITFRQSASDADNRSVATVAGVYLQDQLELTSWLQAIGGLRYDRFEVDFHDRRKDQSLSRTDLLLSPRAALVLKPAETASLYGSYTVSFLPSAGDQFSSLSATSETLKPERFTNYEVGAKWDALPGLALTAAVYRLDRTNTTAPDPTVPGRVVQTGSWRSTGVELGYAGSVTPRWQVAGGVAVQDAETVTATTSAPAGATVPLVPERTLSLWNRYQLLPSLGAGLGVIHQSDMFAAIDNTVTLPAFTRADAALFLRVAPMVSLQVNVENLFDATYYGTSHGNNNIMPGASRTLRFSLSTGL